MERKTSFSNKIQSSKEFLKYESEIRIFEATLQQFNIDMKNSITNDTEYEKDTKSARQCISKLEKSVNELYVLKEANKFSELLENCIHVLYFILNLHEDITEVRNNERCLEKFSEILPNVEMKIQYFENQFAAQYDTFINKYKLVIDEKNNSISELSVVCNILAMADKVEPNKLANVVNEDVFRTNIDSSIRNILIKMEEQHLNINKFINEINNLHQSINANNNEIIKINDMLKEEIDNKKDMESKTNTVKILKTHLTNLFHQLSEILTEKDEATEEVTACNQELSILRNEHKSYKQDINIINNDIEANLVLQFELKTQNLSNTLNSNINVEKELEILEKLKTTHFQEQKKGNDILAEMSKKMKQLVNKICNLKCEIRRIDGEVTNLNKQITILEDLKTKVISNYNKHSFEASQKIKSLTLEKDKLETENKRLISNAESCYNIFTDTQNIISKLQSFLENLFIKNSEEMKLYWKNIKQLQANWNDLDNQINELQVTEKNLTSTILQFENKLKEIIANYKKYLKINEKLKHGCLITMLNKEYQNISTYFMEYHKKEKRILLDLEHCIAQANVQNIFCQELEKIVPGFISDSSFQEQYDVQINKLVLKRNNFETNTKLLSDVFYKMKETQTNIKYLNEVQIKMQEFHTTKIDWELKLKNLTDDLEYLEKEKSRLDKVNNTYSEYINNKIEKMKSHYTQTLEKCKNEIKSLNNTLEETQQKVITLYEIKEELSKQIQTLISEKEVFVEKLRTESLQMKENISVLSDDKKVLTLKLDHVTNDYFKMKAYKTKNSTRYKMKLQEIEDTRNNLKHVLNLIANLERNMQKELYKTSSKLIGAQESLTQNKTLLGKEMQMKNKLYLDLQDEIHNLKKRIENVLNLKHKTESVFQLFSTKVTEFKNKNLEEMQNCETKLNIISTNISQMHTQNYDKEIQDIEQKLKENNDIISEQISQISDLNSKLNQSIDQLKNLKLKKSNLKIKLSQIKTDYISIKQNYKKLIEAETNIAEQMEQFILQEHDSCQHIKKYFNERNDIVKNNNESKTKLNNEVIIFISLQKKHIEFFKTRLSDTYLMKETVNELCSDFCVHILNSFNGKIQHKQILECIEKLKQEESQLENLLHSLYKQKENTDKEYKLVIIEKDILVKIYKQILNYAKTEKRVKVCYSENNYNECTNCQRSIMENTYIKINYEEQLSSVKHSFVIWEEVINQIKSEHNQSQEKLKILQEKYNSEYNIVYENNDKLENEITKLQQLIKTKNNLVSEHENEIKHLNEQYEKELQKLSILKEKNEQLQSEIDKINLNLQKEAETSLQEKNARNSLDCAALNETLKDQNTQSNTLDLIKNEYKKYFMKNLTISTICNNFIIESSKLSDDEDLNSQENIINIKVQKIRSQYVQKLAKSNEDIIKAKQIITSLKTQLWSTVHKYIDLKIENDQFREELQQYKETSSEETISSLKLCLWMTANKYTDIKKKNEKLNKQLQNVTNQEEEDLSNMETNNIYIECCSKSNFKKLIIRTLFIFVLIFIVFLICFESFKNS